MSVEPNLRSLCLHFNPNQLYHAEIYFEMLKDLCLVESFICHNYMKSRIKLGINIEIYHTSSIYNMPHHSLESSTVSCNIVPWKLYNPMDHPNSAPQITLSPIYEFLLIVDKASNKTA